MGIKRILVPTDFSDAAQQALDYAIEFGKPLRPEFILLFVFEPFYYATPTGLYGPADKLGPIIEEQRRGARDELARMARSLEQRGVRLRTLLQSGTPYRVIVDTAKKLQADLIVMGTHGRTGLSHALMGSVAERVVRSAGCPVLTVRASRRAPRRSGRRPRSRVAR